MTESFDVAIVGGCGHVGLPLGLAFAEPRPARRPLRRQPGRGRAVSTAARCRSTSPAPPRCSPPWSGTARWWRRSTPRVIGTAEHVVIVIGTPIDEHLNPDLNAVPAAIEDIARQPRRRPAARAAQHRLPGRHRDGRAPDRASSGSTSTSRSAPSASPRARRWSSCSSCRRSSRPARHAALERATQAVPQPRARDRVPRARGSRARQAVHQHVALHQVRDVEPALHDGQRLRPRLRAHPLGARARLPACRRPPARRLRGRAVSLQGHDAARRVQQQQLPPRPGERARSTRASRSTWSRASSSATTCPR